MSRNNAAFDDAVNAGIAAGGLVLAVCFLSVAGAADAPKAPASEQSAPQQSAILPEPIKLRRREGYGFPEGWLPRPH